MKLLKIVATAIAALMCGGASAQYVSVFRNDGKFHTLDVSAGADMAHRESWRGWRVQIGELEPIPIECVDSMVFHRADVPLLRFSFTDYPDAENVWDKENYIDAALSVDGRNYGGGFDAGAMAVKVKGRGNSTWHMPKKPIRLKFAEKTSLCGFKPAKSYVLLANYVDNSLMRNAVALWLADRLGARCANHFVPVDVEVNGHYQGSYLLTEKIGINGSSVDIDENEGVLIELGIEYDEPYKFRSEGDGLPVMIKDPDFDELYAKNPDGMTPQERLEMWRADFNHAAAEALAGRGAEVFDLDSFVKYYLLYNITCNNEVGYPKSAFLYKEKPGADALYVFGPAWDFDVAFNLEAADSDGNLAESSPDSSFWANGLMADVMTSDGFEEAYRAALERFVTELFPQLLDFIDEYARMIEPSAKRDGLCWPEDRSLGWTWRRSAFDTAANVARLKAWLTARVEHLCAEVEK